MHGKIEKKHSKPKKLHKIKKKVPFLLQSKTLKSLLLHFHVLPLTLYITDYQNMPPAYRLTHIPISITHRNLRDTLPFHSYNNN